MSDENRIPLAGVIGSPISHSKSPRLHGHWLKKYGLQGHYIPMDVAQDDLAEVIRMLPKLGFVGVNVTIPHKEKVLELADLVLSLTESKSEIQHLPLPKDDPVRRRPDLSKARSVLGYEPTVDLEEGLRRTLAAFER